MDTGSGLLANHVATLFTTNNSVARSKTGTAVELTKVRPFINKMVSKSSNKTEDETATSANGSQIIILNIGNANEASQTAFNGILGSKMGQHHKQTIHCASPNTAHNYRVINTNANGISPGATKLTTRFRVINNSNTNNNVNGAYASSPSIIKLNSSA